VSGSLRRLPGSPDTGVYQDIEGYKQIVRTLIGWSVGGPWAPFIGYTVEQVFDATTTWDDPPEWA
jgi:hypothetical protein